MEGQNSLESSGPEPSRSSRRVFVWTALGYSLITLITICGLFLICRHGNTLDAPPPAVTKTMSEPSAQRSDALFHVLFALTAVIVTGLILAKCFAYIGQPPVIGEVVAGILLGPSLLGPETSALILPAHVAPFLGIIAQLGIVLYMFTVGLSLSLDRIKHRAHAAIAISQASIIAPMLLGALLALGLYPRLSTNAVSFTSFALFMGVAMSITAFPVLARILKDRGMIQTELGMIAVSCAATDDVTAWCLLAFVVGIAKTQAAAGISVAAGALVYIVSMLLLIRPLLIRVVKRWDSEHLPRSVIAFVVLALLLSALTTETIGIHAIFGAFLLGALIPHDSAVARTFTQQLEPVVTVLLLPAFFAFTGMRTRIDLVSGINQWLICGLIVLVAIAGKFGGTVVAARLTGLDWRPAMALGTLMNTRGLMELIVLNIGLDLGVISPTLFAMMVLMALVTTMITAPILRLLVPHTTSATEAG